MSIIYGIPLIGDVLKIIFGSKQERDQIDAVAFQSIQSQFANEFGHSRNWFDSLIDGLNRLPRPMFAFGTIYIFWLCIEYPIKFQNSALALQSMPTEGWWILGTIIVFFFGGRLQNNFGRLKVIQSPQIKPQRLARAPPEEPDTQEGITWNKRVETRYAYNE